MSRLHLLLCWAHEKAALAAARRRIAELETELRATRRAIELVTDVVLPKGGSKRSW